jgi:hypothetical protein
MKKQPQDETTKERILTAAAAVFANRGFDGARVEEIANSQGSTKPYLLLLSEQRGPAFNTV